MLYLNYNSIAEDADIIRRKIKTEYNSVKKAYIVNPKNWWSFYKKQFKELGLDIKGHTKLVERIRSVCIL